MSACEDEDMGRTLDAEHGIEDMLKGHVHKDDIKSGKFMHDVNRIDVDLTTLTSGQINWEKAVGSLQWMVDKTKEVLNDHKENVPEVSQYLAKTCVMHVIQCFHHCRDDAAPGYAHAGESTPNPPPSETESRMKCDTDDHSSPPSPST